MAERTRFNRPLLDKPLEVVGQKTEFLALEYERGAKLNVPDPEKTRRELTAPSAEELAAKMGSFGIINYPLP